MKLIPPSSPRPLLRGKVKTFDRERGYGFLVVDHVDGDVFVHYTAIDSEGFKTLADSDEVECTIILMKDRLRAGYVKRTS